MTERKTTTSAERPKAERPPADWNRAADGVGMAGFAFFLLLCTTGVLPWSFWLDAIALWPLLVMSAGVRIAFEKSRAAWLVLLGPAIVLSGLGWLASGARPDLPAGPWEPEAVSRPRDVESLELVANLVGARLRVETAATVPADRLVDGRSLRRHEDAGLDARIDGKAARVLLEGGTRHGALFVPRPRQHWDLRLPMDLPVGVLVKGVGVGGIYDLTAGPFRGARSDGVFLGVEARLPAPRRDTEIRMSGVFNSLSLVVPRGTPVRVHGPGLPLNAVDRGVRGAPGRPGYDVQVQGIFSAVDVRTDPGINPEPPPEPAPPPAEAPPEAEATPSPPAEAPHPDHS
jgi:hypothetical protein